MAILISIPSYGTGAEAALSCGLGFDRLSGSNERTVESVLAFTSIEASPGDFTVAAARYDDTRIGRGYVGFLNVGVAVRSNIRLRAIASRSHGDGEYAAWRLRAGPEVRLNSGVTIAAYHMHLGDTSPASVNALGAEVTKPLKPTLLGQIGGSWVRQQGAPAAVQGLVAMSWRISRHVQLQSEMNVGRSVVTTTTSSPSGSGPMDLPVVHQLGSTPSTTDQSTEKRFEVVGLLGVRLLIP
jgi:hypothetical protein